jgi:hypothetical protein
MNIKENSIGVSKTLVYRKDRLSAKILGNSNFHFIRVLLVNLWQNLAQNFVHGFKNQLVDVSMYDLYLNEHKVLLKHTSFFRSLVRNFKFK